VLILLEAFAMARCLQIARNQKIQNLCFAAINLVIMDCKDIMQQLGDIQLEHMLNNGAHSQGLPFCCLLNHLVLFLVFFFSSESYI